MTGAVRRTNYSRTMDYIGWAPGDWKDTLKWLGINNLNVASRVSKASKLGKIDKDVKYMGAINRCNLECTRCMFWRHLKGRYGCITMGGWHKRIFGENKVAQMNLPHSEGLKYKFFIYFSGIWIRIRNGCWFSVELRLSKKIVSNCK